MKKALRKSSNTSDDDSQLPGAGGGGGGGAGGADDAARGHHHHHHHQHHNNDDDGTDTEQQESLPHDKEVRRSIPKLLRLKAAARIDEKSPTEPQAPPRKISMAQMFKMAAKKENKTKDVSSPPPIKNEPHPAGLYKVEKLADTKNPPDQPLDGANRIPVAAGRRRSILLRQNNLIESSTLRVAPLATADEVVNYKVVNEKNQAMEKRSKLKTPANGQEAKSPLPVVTTSPLQEAKSPVHDTAEPSMFQFDRNDTGDVSDDDNTSYREIEFKNISSSSSQPGAAGGSIRDNGGQHSSDTSWTEDTCRESISPAAMQPVEKPKRRFSSFMGLVRMVVLMRRQQQKLETKKNDGNVVADSIREDADEYDASKSGTIRKRKDTGSVKKKAKRQDSQTSIWSDNIPVITISKTESDECILEQSGSKQRDEPVATGASNAAAATPTTTTTTAKKRHHRKQRNDRGGGSD